MTTKNDIVVKTVNEAIEKGQKVHKALAERFEAYGLDGIAGMSTALAEIELGHMCRKLKFDKCDDAWTIVSEAVGECMEGIKYNYWGPNSTCQLDNVRQAAKQQAAGMFLRMADRLSYLVKAVVEESKN